MDNSERLITAFYYSVGGVILGLGLAIFSSLYLGSTVSSPKIIIFTSVHDKFHRTLILSGFCLLKIAKISLNSSFFPKPIKR